VSENYLFAGFYLSAFIMLVLVLSRDFYSGVFIVSFFTVSVSQRFFRDLLTIRYSFEYDSANYDNLR